jgi:CheY-like chemotaxis protein
MDKQGATILVVDNEREIVYTLQHNLTAHGYRAHHYEAIGSEMPADRR